MYLEVKGIKKSWNNKLGEKMIKANYIQTMDFTFEDVIILNCDNEQDVENKIKESEVLKIQNGSEIEYINSNYIMYYKLD